MQDDRTPPNNAQEMMGPSGAGTSFLGRFSKGMNLTTMKEKTRAASASLSDKTKAASASLSGKMTSIGNTLMSVAKKSEEAAAPLSSPPASSEGSVAQRPVQQLNLPPPGQLRCFACAMLMAYPGVCERIHACAVNLLLSHSLQNRATLLTGCECADGVQQVKCPGCGTVNNTPPADPPNAGVGSDRVLLSCFACESQISAVSTASSMTCSVCTSHNEVLFSIKF